MSDLDQLHEYYSSLVKDVEVINAANPTRNDMSAISLAGSVYSPPRRENDAAVHTVINAIAERLQQLTVLKRSLWQR